MSIGSFTACPLCENALLPNTAGSLVALCWMCAPTIDRSPISAAWVDGLATTSLQRNSHADYAVAMTGPWYAFVTVPSAASGALVNRMFAMAKINLRIRMRPLVLAMNALLSVPFDEWEEPFGRTPKPRAFHARFTQCVELMVEALGAERLSPETVYNLMLGNPPTNPPAEEWAKWIREKAEGLK